MTMMWTPKDAADNVARYCVLLSGLDATKHLSSGESYTLVSSVPNVPYVIMDQSVKIYCGINQDLDCHSPRDR